MEGSRASGRLEGAGGGVRTGMVREGRGAGVAEAERLLEEAGGVPARVIGSPDEDPQT